MKSKSQSKSDKFKRLVIFKSGYSVQGSFKESSRAMKSLMEMIRDVEFQSFHFRYLLDFELISFFLSKFVIIELF